MALKWRQMYSISLCFFSCTSLFSRMIFYKFPLTWAVGWAHFLRNLPCLKNIQFDWSQFEWFDSQENQWLLVVVVCSFNYPFCLSRHWRHYLLPELTDVRHASPFLGFVFVVISHNESHPLHFCHHEILSHSFQSEILLCTTIQSLYLLVRCYLFK
jgi:hypothetical protein